MFKNIIPSLVSFDTNLGKINGFYFSDDFNFYPKIEKKSIFHYKIFIDNNIVIPREYDFRNGYFLKFENKWYYERKLGIFTLKFCFDLQNKTFSFNKLYSLIQFEIGHIYPVGRHIADLINFELYLKDFVVYRGCSFCYQNKNICIIAPKFNGKTSLVKKILKKGGKYIAEDIIVIDHKENKVYPSNITTGLFARKINKKVKMIGAGKIIEISRNIDKLFLIQNSTNVEYNSIAKKFFDYLNLCSLSFNNNPFVKSYIFEENLSESLLNKINELKQSKINYRFESVKMFRFDFLDQNHGK